jgi:hypothetical protein
LTPQIPTPFAKRYASEASSTIVRLKPTNAPMNHTKGVRRDSAIDAILSVSVVNE